VLFGLRVAVLFGHAKVHDVNDVGRFGIRPSDQEVIRFDVAVDQVLLVDRLDAGKLQPISSNAGGCGAMVFTICFATMTTVLMENFRLQ
jgi:hypothetical protein